MDAKNKKKPNDERRQNATPTFKKYLQQQHLKSTDQVQKSFCSDNMF